MRPWIYLAAFWSALAPAVYATEFWVDASAKQGGDGTTAMPFTTISDAVKTARGGDTITVRAGVYRESVTLTQSGTAQQPTVLRAAPGQRVILSGFSAIANWTDEGGGLYSALVPSAPSALYVGLQQQPISRWPQQESPMRLISRIEPATQTFHDAQMLASPTFLKEVQDTPKDVMAFLYLSGGNFYRTMPLASLDVKSGAFKVADPKGFPSLKGTGDKYQLVNHRALIQTSGHWAFEKLGDKTAKLYFRPRTPDDLTNVQFPQARRAILIGRSAGQVEHIRVEGLQVFGSAGPGIEISGAQHITVTGNVVCFNAGSGISTRRSKDITVRANVVQANGNGVSFASTDGAVVEANDIGMNMMDGLIVAGNISGRPDGEPETKDVTVRKNYIHHHLLMGHPDNIQVYRGVKNLLLEDNVILWGGQGIMTEETQGNRIQNCVFAGTSAVAVIFGHKNSSDWTVTQSTIGLGGWGLFSMTGQGYRLQNNIIWEGALAAGEGLESNYNLFWRQDAAAPVAIARGHRRYADLRALAAEAGQERNSARGVPMFRNAPISQVVAPPDSENRHDRLALRKGSDSQFARGDRIEVTGDGVLREVTEIGAGYICFTPPLPGQPFRDSLIWNWKQAQNAELDLRPQDNSQALRAGDQGRPVGAALNIPAYRGGDFDGDEKRDIPAVPSDVQEAMPGPSRVVMPLYGM